MPNYSNGKIYKIVCNTTNKIYIGSTTQSLTSRLGQHKCNYKRFLNGLKLTDSVFEVLENSDYVIILIENFNCNSKKDLFIRERYYIEKTECVNKNLPIRTRKEYCEANKERKKQYDKIHKELNKNSIKEKRKTYLQNNKDKIKEKQKEYNEKNKDKIKEKQKEYKENNKQKIKEYRKRNKDKIKEKQKEYNKNNKEKRKEYNEKNKEKIKEQKRQWHLQKKLKITS